MLKTPQSHSRPPLPATIGKTVEAKLDREHTILKTWNFFFCVCAWEVERGPKKSFDRLALEQPVGNHG
jgi:hypothetical protein